MLLPFNTLNDWHCSGIFIGSSPRALFSPVSGPLSVLVNSLPSPLESCSISLLPFICRIICLSHLQSKTSSYLHISLPSTNPLLFSLLLSPQLPLALHRIHFVAGPSQPVKGLPVRSQQPLKCSSPAALWPRSQPLWPASLSLPPLSSHGLTH